MKRVIVVAAILVLALVGFALAAQDPAAPTGGGGGGGGTNWSWLITAFGGPTAAVGAFSYAIKVLGAFLDRERQARLAHAQQIQDGQKRAHDAQLQLVQTVMDQAKAIADSNRECGKSLEAAADSVLQAVTQARELLREVDEHKEQHQKSAADTATPAVR